MAKKPFSKPRRAYRIVKRAVRRRTTRRLSVVEMIGLGTGFGMSAFGSHGSTFEYFKADPAGQAKYVANGIMAGMTGYDMMNKEFNASSLVDFWVPVIGSKIASNILGRYFGLDRIHLGRKLSIA